MMVQRIDIAHNIVVRIIAIVAVYRRGSGWWRWWWRWSSNRRCWLYDK